MMFLGQVKLVIQKFDHLGSAVAVVVVFCIYILTCTLNHTGAILSSFMLLLILNVNINQVHSTL